MNIIENIFKILEQTQSLIFNNELINVIVIVIAVLLARKFGSVIIDKAIRKIIVPEKQCSKKEEKQREDTLISVILTAFNIIILIVAFLMILEQLGINITPLLAGIGFLGIALGFGAQHLVRDIISGLFIIIENQYRAGDWVKLLDVSGNVENISLRMTTLRDLNGTVHNIPNGEIKLVSNFSKYYARININIGVSYDSDIEHVIAVINKTGKELAESVEWKDNIKTAPKFLRVNDFAESSVIIKILGEVEPSTQWAVAGELRKRLKVSFEKEGIQIPLPQRVLHTKISKK